MLADELLELIERIHLIPSGEVGWQEVLAETTRIMNARMTALLVYDMNQLEVVDYDYDEFPHEWADAYRNYYVKLDRRVHFARANPRQRVITDYDFIDDRGIARDEFYQDFLLPCGLKYYAGIIQPRKCDSPRLELAVNRAVDQSHYAASDLLVLSHIASHLGQVYELTRGSNARMLQGSLTTAALEHFSFPMLIVDRHVELYWANEVGRTLLDSGNGLHLCKSQLHGGCVAETRQLRDLVHSACGTGLGPRGGIMALTGSNGLQDCSMFVTPLHFAQDNSGRLRRQQRRFALLLIRQNSAKPLRRLDFMQRLYRLSGQECRLLELLVAGHELRVAGDMMGITYETARQYLKQLFGKIGVRSQSQLMREVLENPAFFVDPGSSDA